MNDRIDTASRLIRAPASTVYRAFSNPSAMERWLPPRGMTGRMLRFDFREGGSYHMRLTYDEPDRAQGKTSADSDEVSVRFASLAEDRLIEEVVTFESDDPAFSGEMRITWDFAPTAEGTLVSVRCENVPHGISAEDHEAGLSSTLRNLAELVESEIS